MIAVLDHVRTCGSLDVYLLADADRWYIVEGAELTEDGARAAVEAPETLGDGVSEYDSEAIARGVFEEFRG